MRISDWSSDVCSSDLPVGTWKTIDDATGKAKSLVTIRDDDGTLHGKVVKLFNPFKPNPTCEKCEGKRKDQPIMGMEILWGLKKDDGQRSEEHTSELQSLKRNSYADVSLTKKKT